MTTANIVPNVVPVNHFDRLYETLTIDVPEGYDDVKKLVKKVLEYNGSYYTFTGWNSDRNVAYFRRSTEVATIRRGNR